MKRIAGTILFLSFTALLLCGWGFLMACHGNAIHSLLESSAILTGLVIPSLALFLAALIFSAPEALQTSAVGEDRPNIRPDPGIFLPLQSAFSDGILNTKVF